MFVHHFAHAENKREIDSQWDDELDDDTLGTIDLCEYICFKFVPVLETLS